jgi:hypothetical protein
MAFIKAEQVVRAVAICGGFEIFPAVVRCDNNVCPFTVHERIKGVLSALNPANGIILLKLPIPLLVPDIFNTFMRVQVTAPFVNAANLKLSHLSSFLQNI